ncbi:hypothetical protein DIPPA_05725 [Diplonema papillatum]|nr:hypothetical protein DIPPA_05725 [Diplonema papillatum]
MGDKQSKAAGSGGAAKKGTTKPLSKEEYQAALKAEQERMLVVSTAPKEGEDKPPSGILHRLEELDPLEPLIPTRVGADKRQEAMQSSQLKSDDLIGMLADFQTATRASNNQLLTNTTVTVAEMRGVIVLCEGVERRVQGTFQGLSRLQTDLATIQRLERSIAQCAQTATSCAKLVDGLNAMLLANQALVREERRSKRNSRSPPLSSTESPCRAAGPAEWDRGDGSKTPPVRSNSEDDGLVRP